MKRAFQIAAAILMLVLPVRPALADATCRMGMATSQAACPMGMDEMGPDCPMAQHMAQDACAQDCCNHALPQTAVIPGTSAKPRSSAAAPTMTCASGSPEAQAPFAPSSTPIAAGSSPPRYILYRIFRI